MFSIPFPYILIYVLLVVMSGAIHTRVEVCRMDSEMSGLVEQPWLQLICYAICLSHDHNFR